MPKILNEMNSIAGNLNSAGAYFNKTPPTIMPIVDGMAMLPCRSHIIMKNAPKKITKNKLPKMFVYGIVTLLPNSMKLGSALSFIGPSKV